MKPGADVSGDQENFTKGFCIMKGYVQVYTGDGKGKTTAALGLSLRAAGAGLRVYICQFLKAGDFSEIKALKRFSDLITVEQFGTGSFIKNEPSPEEMEAGMKGLARLKEAMLGGSFDVIIAEEGNVAVTCGLFPVSRLCDIIDHKPEQVELVITGRGAPPEIIERADLVTEMKAIKHYFFNGVGARVGIEK
jgi:cob(I)alamin adenosyltransferase